MNLSLYSLHLTRSFSFLTLSSVSVSISLLLLPLSPCPGKSQNLFLARSFKLYIYIYTYIYLSFELLFVRHLILQLSASFARHKNSIFLLEGFFFLWFLVLLEREMAQRSHVPKFGNWDGEENVPYTAYFEKARKGRGGGKMINPNDPEENPDLVSDSSDPGQAPRSGGSKLVSEDPTVRKATKTAHERQRSREDGELRQFADSPARHENMNRRAGNESVPQRFAGRGVGYGEAQKRPGRQGPQSIGSDNSMEQSPLHPKARVSGRGTVGAPSPSWEGGKGSYESSHGTPGRSRLKPKGDESPDKGAAVPKFGEWDENNPSSADGYTHIFNKVREERQIGAGKVPGMPSESPYHGARRHSPSNRSKSCCFPWGRK